MWLEVVFPIAAVRQIVTRTTYIVSRFVTFLDLSVASYSRKNTMFQEQDYFPLLGDIQDAPAEYGLAV
jgi:hypothetical protein